MWTCSSLILVAAQCAATLMLCGVKVGWTWSPDPLLWRGLDCAEDVRKCGGVRREEKMLVLWGRGSSATQDMVTEQMAMHVLLLYLASTELCLADCFSAKEQISGTFELMNRLMTSSKYGILVCVTILLVNEGNTDKM